jgi:hypothetical protein
VGERAHASPRSDRRRFESFGRELKKGMRVVAVTREQVFSGICFQRIPIGRVHAWLCPFPRMERCQTYHIEPTAS